jgi:hypothetical protein
MINWRKIEPTYIKFDSQTISLVMTYFANFVIGDGKNQVESLL